jgi:PAS domain S-box-containing protein
MPLRHLPIQRKLVGFIFLTTLTALLGGNLLLFVYESRRSEQTTTHSLETMGEIIASNSTAALAFDDPKLGEEIISGLRAEPDVSAAALFDKEGRLFAVYPANLPAALFPQSPLHDGTIFSLRTLVLYKPVIQGGNRVGTLYIKSDLGGMYRRMRVYSAVLVGILMGAAILAFFLSNFLQRQISQPILNLAETARIVSEQRDYSVRAEKQSGDELGFVTDAFNSMLEQIQLNHAALGESEERFRVVADSAPVLIWITDTGMVATWFNRYWLNFVGKRLAQEVGQGWIDNLHPEDRDHCLKIYAAAYEQRQYFRVECRLLRSDGTYRWLLNQGTPRYQGGEFVGFIGSAVDITDNKEAEEAVRSSELQMRLVTDHASVFLCQIDQSHRFRYVNRSYSRRYGLEPPAIIGKHLSEVLGQGAYELIRERLSLALSGERQEYEAEIPYSTLGKRWIHAVYEPERRDDGSIGAIVTVLTDITERRLAAQELERARDKAIQASRAKDDFLAALSHELRTPLNPVLLIATDAVNNPDLTEEARNDFETIRKNVELEARLIEDLLDLTRITNGKMRLERQSIEVHAVIRDALTTVRGDLESKHIEFVLALADEKAVVRADPVRLQQVFWNVVKNAVKFTPENGKITVTTRLAHDSKTFVMEVTDTGIGLSAEEMVHVFEAFSQGDHAKGAGSHRFGGLGLGLAISRKLIELHAGRIYVQSEGRNRGCTFYIELPLFASLDLGQGASDKGLGRQDAHISGAASDGSSSNRTILLIEDHAPTRVALERLLMRRSFRVLAGASIADANRIIAKDRIDILISDIGLPDGSGYDLMADFKKRFQMKGIALSGFGMDGDVALSHATGFDVHLTKPVSITALDAAIATIDPGVLQS